MRRRKSAEALTDFSEEVALARRGPHSELNDDQLRHRREDVVQAFEGVWGDIGWQLQTCKRAEDLVGVFKPLAESFVQNIVSMFWYPSTQTVSADALRKLRRHLHSLTEESGKAEESKYRAQEQLQGAEVALAQAPANQRRIIKQERERRFKEAKEKAEESDTLLDALRQSRLQVLQLEASFAREQLLLFLKSKRYRLEPLSLANAVAGLPYMTWRQSTRRCVPMRRYRVNANIAVDNMAYRLFKSISHLAKGANKATEPALVKSFRDSIALLPKDHRLQRIELAKNWFYLERAIRDTYRIKPHPRALPFEIQKRYLTQIGSRSAVDIILAEQAEIKL